MLLMPNGEKFKWLLFQGKCLQIQINNKRIIEFVGYEELLRPRFVLSFVIQITQTSALIVPHILLDLTRNCLM